MDGRDGDLFGPDDPRYHETRAGWNAMIDRRPAAIARCRSVTDVVAALRYARREGLEVAVRAGGHSVSGHSSTDGGVQIDLRPMNRVVVDAEARRARVQGGALLRDLDRETHRFGLATTGGFVSHTGVGGLTLGGGYGALARRYGLACDNLVAAELVTADGSVVRTGDAEDAELLWGLRGGGGNFGIVTEFEFRLHPVESVVSGSMDFAIHDGPALLRAYRDVASDADRGYVCAFDVSGGRAARPGSDEPTFGPPTVGVWYTFAGPDLDAGAAFADALRAVAEPIREEAEVKPYPAMQGEGDESMAPGRRQYWKASLLWELSDQMIDAFFERGARLEGTPCWQEVLLIGGAISDVGEDDSAYSNRDACFDYIAGASWDDPEDDERNMTTSRETWRAIAPYSRGGVYVNNLGEDAAERVREAYGASKFERLVALKDRWDPDNVFRGNANIEPSPA
jgi:FAD/FMN-containing dehydrogenase